MKPVLGRGLNALLGKGSPPAKPPQPPAPPTATPPPAPVPPPASAPAADTRERVVVIPVGRLHPCPLQPRKAFLDETLRELADSIREQGIIQPLIVRERGDGFQIIAGERRWRAAQIAKLTSVPVIIRQVDDRTTLEMMLIENLQREDLNPIDEALGYAELIAQFQLTQEEAAVKVGKSRVAVANSLRLLRLPPEVQDWLKTGELSTGHAKVILGLPAAEQQKLAAEKTIQARLSVRQLEELIALWQSAPAAKPGMKQSQPSGVRDVHIIDLESRLREHFGTKVSLRYRKGKGTLEIRFFSDDELQRVLDIAGFKMD